MRGIRNHPSSRRSHRLSLAARQAAEAAATASTAADIGTDAIDTAMPFFADDNDEVDHDADSFGAGDDIVDPSGVGDDSHGFQNLAAVLQAQRRGNGGLKEGAAIAAAAGSFPSDGGFEAEAELESIFGGMEEAKPSEAEALSIGRRGSHNPPADAGDDDGAGRNEEVDQLIETWRGRLRRDARKAAMRATAEETQADGSEDVLSRRNDRRLLVLEDRPFPKRPSEEARRASKRQLRVGERVHRFINGIRFCYVACVFVCVCACLCVCVCLCRVCVCVCAVCVWCVFVCVPDAHVCVCVCVCVCVDTS